MTRDEWNRVGKSLGDVSWFHEDFIPLERDYLNRQISAERMYAKGPHRSNCIICQGTIDATSSYGRFGVQYAKCGVCGHFNGLFELTNEFLDYAYVESETVNDELKPYSQEFSQGKMADDFQEVVKRIYSPKAEFMREALIRDGFNPNNISVTDVGCGAGHFIAALEHSGIEDVSGFDTLHSAILTAKSHLSHPSRVKQVAPEYLSDFLTKGSADIVSMMCVLPHLPDPIEALRAMSQNPNMTYTFQKLPMWSFATLLESAFPNLRSRVLAADHTHVFTQESLRWLEASLGLRRVASWSFGSDALDLQRKLIALISAGGASLDFQLLANQQLVELMDNLQRAVDESGQSSEIHVLWALND
jgi:SAM-dependent methyltransferase